MADDKHNHLNLDGEFWAATVFDAYMIARDEAYRYQALASHWSQAIGHEVSCYRWLAKRDSASRIARMIRFGPEYVNLTDREDQNGGHLRPNPTPKKKRKG